MSSPVPAATPQSFATVFGRLKPHMTQLDAFLRSQLSAFEPEIREMADYCIDTSGKRIRPALVFLSGWQSFERASDALVRAAAVVELVHLATLVHDDIMDEADLRRGRRTAARTYGPEAAVLLGDTLFSHALNLATQYPTTAVCAAVSESTRKVCAGEIVQTLRRGTLNLSLDDYYRVIDLKTAELFRLSCALGGELAGLPAPYAKAAAAFGRHLGIAYQIYDDLVDFFGDETKIGKTLGTDLASGKLTLPLIELIKRSSERERRAITDELLKKQPPQTSLRIEQMRSLGVFEAVVEAIERELVLGEAELAPFSSLAPTGLLLELNSVLRSQVQALKG
ncbi:MAG: polyprenyl synthetase family protein [Opitutaceae bacterium]|nr:polyprenyl synthetase family protein [Opitutaceae bacterium]